jgi:hypothetical protein
MVMIKRASSSEIFDIYATRMISKRAAPSLSFLTELLEGASKIGKSQIDNVAMTAVKGSGAAPTAIEGLSLLSKADDIILAERLENLVNAAHTDVVGNKIVDVAKKLGYSADNPIKFLDDYAKEFKAMGVEYEALTASGTVVPADALAFLRKHDRTIRFFNETADARSIGRLVTPEAIRAGELGRGAGRVGVSIADGLKLSPVGQATSLGEKAYSLVSTVGGAITLAFWVGGGYALYQGYQFIKPFLQSPEGEEHFLGVKKAIDCINDIDLKPGSPAVAERQRVIDNIIDYSKLEDIATMTDKKEIISTSDKAAIAAQNLLGSKSDSGSIPVFINMISNEGFAGKNLNGYFAGNTTNSMLAGGAAGAFVGLKGGVVGAVIGGAIGAGAAWAFLGKWYKNQIDCLGNAADQIKYLNDKFELLSGQKSQDGSGATTSTGGSARGTGGGAVPDAPTGPTADDVSFVKRVLAAGQNEKLIGVPGIELVNEEKMMNAYVMAWGGDLNGAAKHILSKDGSISAAIDQIRKSNPNNLLVPIDRRFKKDPANEQFLKFLYTAIYRIFQSAVDGNRKAFGFTPGINELSQLIAKHEGIQKSSKNNWNIMNKNSKSINNQELIRKAAETRVSYFGDANLGLKDQLTKSYYAGLTGMYNEKPTKKSSDDKLYGFQEETGEDLILQAHPKSVTLADAMGKGGLVENGLEAKEKSNYIALNTPTGNFQSKYASTIGYLNKLAKAADEQGKKEVSRLIKQTIQNLK